MLQAVSASIKYFPATNTLGRVFWTSPVKSLLVQILQQDFSSLVVADAVELRCDGLQCCFHLCGHRRLTAVQEAAYKATDKILTNQIFDHQVHFGLVKSHF